MIVLYVVVAVVVVALATTAWVSIDRRRSRTVQSDAGRLDQDRRRAHRPSNDR